MNEATSKLEKLQPAKAYATFDNLAQRAEEPHHYHAFYKALMQGMVSGVVSYTFSNNLKGKVKQLGRTFGVPLCIMAKDIHHPIRITRIMDNIADTHDIPSLTSFIQQEDGMSGWDATDQTESNFTEEMRHKKVIAAVGKRWNKYGYTAMDAMNNMDRSMLEVSPKATKNKKTERETERALDYYQMKMFDGERNPDTIVSKDAFKAVLNPMFQNGILNFQKPAFKELMQGSKGYDGQMSTSAREMRKHLTRKVNSYGQDLSGLKYDTSSQQVYKKKFEILFKKFSEYFKEDFRREDREKIKERFLAGNIVEDKNNSETVR